MLSVEDLTCVRGGLTILSGVTFRVPDGGALALRGPNGAGKTTLLRTLVGLQNARNGQVSRPPSDFAYGSHSDAVKGALTVRENLTFWAEVYGTRDIKAALKAFGLEALVDRPAAELSAGQSRRLGLARLLLTGRPIWALDEPTVALDTASVDLFAAAVATHRAAGGLVLMATHIDLGLEVEVLDVSAFRPAPEAMMAGDFDEAFL